MTGKINLNNFFESKEVFLASDEKLIEALKQLSTGHVPNNMVRHREVIRALVINTILNKRHLERLDSQNRKLTYVVVVLMVIDIVLFLVQIL